MTHTIWHLFKKILKYKNDRVFVVVGSIQYYSLQSESEIEFYLILLNQM